MSDPAAPSLVWLRLDLRLADQPALAAAVEAGGPVVPVFVWAPEEEGAWAPGAATRWWLHHSLERLDAALRERGSRLVVRAGPARETLLRLVRETGAARVFWNRRYEPAVTARDAALKEALREAGCTAESFAAGLLREPWTVRNQSGRPFQVFTPFWRHCLSGPDPGTPLPAPSRLRAPVAWPASKAVAELGLLPRIRWDAGLAAAWEPGEAGAARRLDGFLAGALAAYAEARDLPAQPGTSRLSPHLHFGEISPRQIWHAVRAVAERAGWETAVWRNGRFLTEVGWREFAYHLLYHFPQTPERPLREDFERFPWQSRPEWVEAWQRGRTGYPLVDAGMRELWATGWMHNRVRMVVGSFLVKHLLHSWSVGAQWFWDTLVDADLASNTLGWQWVGGCGADAAPYFRVFNPVSQGLKFDAEGEYVRRWVPELARLPASCVHAPWEASPSVLRAAGVTLGREYPAPLVDHARARAEALAAFSRIRGG